MKQERIVDQELLDTVRSLPCLACADKDPHGAYAAVFENEVRSHPHHVISRGAGGGDVAENVMALCFAHHREIHSIGNREMARRYKTVAYWLTVCGHLDGQG